MGYNKLIKVKVKLPSGEERFLVFRPINAPRDRYACEICPYDKYCVHIPHPEEPDNKELSFQEFCGSVDRSLIENSIARNPDNGNGEEDMNEITSDAIPVEGTIEENLSDVIEINQELLKKNPQVSLHKVIDTVCKDWCDKYEPSYCNCTANNASCMLCGLFKNSKKEFPESTTSEEQAENGDNNPPVNPGTI